MIAAVAGWLRPIVLAGLVALPAAAQVAPPSAARIQNPDVTFTPGADHDTIVERGWIRIGVYADFAPYSWEENGTPKGTDVDLARLIGEALGVETRIVMLEAGETTDADLRHHVWKGPLIGGEVVNVLMRVPQDRELAIRNELIVLMGSYAKESLAISYDTAVHAESPPTPAYFRFDTVGVENDSLSDFYLSGMARGQLQPNIRRFRDTGAAMAALKAGEVTAVMGPLAQLEFGGAEGIAIHQPPLPGLSRGTWTVGVALRHNYRQLGYAVEDAIRAARDDGRLAAIFARHGLTLVPPDW